MKSLQILLTVLFIIIVYQVVVQKMKSDIVIGTTCLMFVVLWVSWDNLGAWDYNKTIEKTMETCGLKPAKSPKRKEIEKKIKEKTLKKDIAEADKQETKAIKEKIIKDQNGGAKKKTEEKKEALLPFSKRPMPLEYSENNYKKNTFNELGSLGDNEFAHLQKHRSNINRVAMDNFARVDKFTNINYFAEELKNHANSRWWDDEELEKEF